MAWLGLFFEMLHEFLILPLYFTFRETIAEPKVTINKVKTGFLAIMVVFILSCRDEHFPCAYTTMQQIQTCMHSGNT